MHALPILSRFYLILQETTKGLGQDYSFLDSIRKGKIRRERHPNYEAAPITFAEDAVQKGISGESS